MGEKSRPPSGGTTRRMGSSAGRVAASTKRATGLSGETRIQDSTTETNTMSV